MSFAADMKDFVSAYQAGDKLVTAQSDRDYKRILGDQAKANTEAVNQKNNDEEGDRLTKEGLRLRNRNLSVNGDLAAERIRRSREASANDAAARAAAAAQPPAAVPTDVAPVQPSVTEVQPAVPDAPAYSAGGSVQKFAGGGAVGDGPDAEDDADTDDVAEEAVPASPTSDTTDISARARDRGFSPQAGLDGVKAGMIYGSKALGLHTPGSAVGGASPGRERAAKAWSTGAHAAPPEDISKIEKMVNPDGKLGESETKLAAIGALYQFKMKNNDSEGAARAAFQMVQHYRQASQRYAVIAADAFEKGDLDKGAHAAMKAYANVPDDKDVKFEKTPDGQISYTYTDSNTGKVLRRGVESPDKLAAASMGFAKQGFDQSLVAAVSQQPIPAAKPAVDPNSLPLKGPERTATTTGIDKAWKDQNPPPEDDKAPPKYTPDDVRDMKGAAFRIASHTANPRITHDEAVSVASKIADPTLTTEKTGFKLGKRDASGGAGVTFGNKTTYVPGADLDTLLARRSAAMEKMAADKKAGEGTGISVKGAIDGVKSAASGALDWAKGDLAKWAKQNPEMMARVQSALNAGGRAASEAKAYIEKEMAKPNLWKGMAKGPGEGL